MCYARFTDVSKKAPDGTARCPGFAPTGREPVTFDPALLDLADHARIESAALDVLQSGIGIFNKDFYLVYANRSFRDLRFLPERLCVPGTDLRTSSATSPRAAIMAPARSTAW
jgi:hypothetical protein